MKKKPIELKLSEPLELEKEEPEIDFKSFKYEPKEKKKSWDRWKTFGWVFQELI